MFTFNLLLFISSIVFLLFVCVLFVLFRSEKKIKRKVNFKLLLIISIETSILSILILSVTFAQEYYSFNFPLISFFIGLSLFIFVFYPLYNFKNSIYIMLNYDLKKTILKYITMVVIPLFLLIIFDNLYVKDSFYFKESFLINDMNLLIGLVCIIVLSIFIYLFYKTMNFDRLIKIFGTKTFIKVFLIVFCIQIIHVGITEEFLFRIFLIGALLPYGEGIAILVSSLIFGFGHIKIMEDSLNLFEKVSKVMLFHFPLGIFFGVLWTRANSYILNILLHSFFNSIILAFPAAKIYILQRK